MLGESPRHHLAQDSSNGPDRASVSPDFFELQLDLEKVKEFNRLCRKFRYDYDPTRAQSQIQIFQRWLDQEAPEMLRLLGLRRFSHQILDGFSEIMSLLETQLQLSARRSIDEEDKLQKEESPEVQAARPYLEAFRERFVAAYLDPIAISLQGECVDPPEWKVVHHFEQSLKLTSRFDWTRQDECLTYLEEHLAMVEKDLRDPVSQGNRLYLIRTIFSFGEQSSHLNVFKELLLRLIREGVFSQKIYGQAIDMVQRYVPEELPSLISSFLEFYHLPVASMIEAWSLGNVPVSHQLDAIESLEEERSGITKTLFTEFNLACFGRYPLSLLIQQYDYRDNTEIPYGILVFAKEDWNSAFASEMVVLGMLQQDIGEHQHVPLMLLRVIEVDGMAGILQMRRKLRSRYPLRCPFGYFAGHGTRKSIAWGKKGIHRRHKLTLKDVSKPIAARALDIFERGATVILSACSTGQDDGLAQKISEIIEGKVLGPNKDCGVQDIQVRKRKGKIRSFSARYTKPDARRVYVQGQLLAA